MCLRLRKYMKEPKQDIVEKPTVKHFYFHITHSGMSRSRFENATTKKLDTLQAS